MPILNNDVKIYKDFLIFERYFADIELYDDSKTYKEFNRQSKQLIEDKLSNRSCIKFQEYYSNGTVENAIDNYYLYRNETIPRLPYSQVLDFCFNDLKMDAKTFLNTFGNDSAIKNRYIDYEYHYEAFNDFRNKDIRLKEFLTDDKILDFFNQRKLERIIQSANQKDINNIGLYI